MREAFTELKELSLEIHHYNSILTLLHWDQETYMPSGGITARSHQIAHLSIHVHELKKSQKFKKCLQKLSRAKDLTSDQKVMVREWKKEFARSTKFPAHFIKTFSQTTTEASQIWSAAKKQNNFPLFAPFLQKIIDLNREKAQILGFEDHPYDALIEGYEPCMTSKKLTLLFDSMRKELTSLLKKRKPSPDRFLHKKIEEKTQLALGHFFTELLPMEPEYTRLDLSSHPFSLALHPHDSRITTRILPNNFMSNIFSVLHEAGHSMYEMGLPTEHWGTPLSEFVSLSIHESQSRFWETLIGRSLPFWEYVYPLLQQKLPHLKKIPLSQFYRGINHVNPSFIRVEADEVTYGLHVIARFELEKALISGDLAVNDLPDAWNSKMKELFGITPPTAAQGCLQDIHWSLGDFGYFPTYALGNMIAAQLFAAFEKNHPDWSSRLAKGDFPFIRDWLRINIHKHGKRFNTEELVKRITGHKISTKPYTDYLKKKYTTLWK